MLGQCLMDVSALIAIDYYKPRGSIFCALDTIFGLEVLDTFSRAAWAFRFSHGNLVIN